MYSIDLNPVYSCPAETVPTNVKLPAGWQLAWHQAETLRALRDPKIDVVFNTAMTGDGKSLAAYLEVLQGQAFAIGLYPTNELARDQETQVNHYIETFKPANAPRVRRLSGALLEIYAENEGLRKGSAIATRAGQSEVLITNPDLFHYLHQGAYLMNQDAPDKLWNRIDKDFDLFIFDEFHVYAAPQIASVLNTMLLIQVTNRRKKFLFLSATPSDALLNRLAQAGFRCRVVNPVAEGKYHAPKASTEAEALAQQGWRQVARAIELTFVPLEPTAKASETWLKDNLAQILKQFLDHPGSKGAIILNSIAAVKRLTPLLREQFAQQGLTVRENTGLSSQAEKAQSLAADLVIGTSTIDVGVDFKISFLIFESADAGNFIQRLGRLGRHDGYEKAGQPIRFDGFRAYALVPNFFVERLFAGEAAVLSNGEQCDRIDFHRLITQHYRQINDFEGYYKHWGAVQSLYLAQQLSKAMIKQQYADSLQKFSEKSQTAFGLSLKAIAGRVYGWAEAWQHLSGKKGNPIAKAGGSLGDR
ncbi:MAG: type I-D CRISPR-associated helicase Cas3', partial [Leptolyngbya sp. SIO4C1]|nr:type I-D CRISPR-associated helicase Cas3' [Leptolyngbya sp. SIO4C1]